MSDCSTYLSAFPFTPTQQFDQGGFCYFGIPDQMWAQWAIDNGYDVVHNPNFPTGAGLYIQLPEPAAVAPPEPNPISPPAPPPEPVTPPPEPVTPPPEPTPAPTPTTPTCPDGFVWDDALQACISVAGTTSGAPPEGPIAPSTWDGTQESQDVSDAWSYYVDVYANKLPAQRDQLATLATRPITG